MRRIFACAWGHSLGLILWGFKPVSTETPVADFSTTASPALPRLAQFRPFAVRIGVDHNVLRQDDECPPTITIGGVEFAILEELARFEIALLIRAWGEDAAARHAKKHRRSATTAEPATV